MVWLLVEDVVCEELSGNGKTDAHYCHQDDEGEMGDKHPKSIHRHIQDSENQNPLEDTLDAFESHDAISFVLNLSVL